MNYLTPAEFLTPFARDLSFMSETRMASPVSDPSGSGEFSPVFSIQYRKVDLVDIEEWEPMTEDSLKTSFPDALDKNKPRIADILKINHSDVVNRPRTVLMNYGWSEACNFTSEYLKTMAKDYEWSNLNECQALLYVLSSQDQLDKIITEMDRKYSDICLKALGESLVSTSISIIRLFVVLKTEDPEKDSADVDSLIKAHIKSLYNTKPADFAVNTRTESSYTDCNLWKEEHIYIKKKIRSYDLGTDKVDSNQKNLPRGYQMDNKGLELIKYQMKEMFVRYLPERFRLLIEKKWQQIQSEKRKVKKGFMGLSMFKKEEKAYFTREGKYVLTDVEKEVKKYADLLLVFGMVELAKEEYAYVVENLGKKSPETTNALNEMVTYCGLALSSIEKPNYPREKMKHVNKAMMEHLLKAINIPFRYARLQLVMNMLNHVYYDGNELPPPEAQRSIMQGHYKFSVKQNHLMLDWLSPFFLQQYSRYNLLNRTRNIRTFYSMTVESSANYLKRADLKSYAAAGYIICSKFYCEEEMKTWGILNELVYYNLAILIKDVASDDQLELDGFITALNNMQIGKRNQPSDLVRKADNGLKLKLRKGIKESQSQLNQDSNIDLLTMEEDPLTANLTSSLTRSQALPLISPLPSSLPNLEYIASKKLKMLSIRGFSIITANEFPEQLAREEDRDAIPDESESNPLSMTMMQSGMLQSSMTQSGMNQSGMNQSGILQSGLNQSGMQQSNLLNSTTAPIGSPGSMMTSGLMHSGSFGKEAPKSAGSKQGAGSLNSRAVDKEQTIKRHYEVLESILRSKFPQACQDSLRGPLNYSKIGSFGDKVKFTSKAREVFKGEKVVYQFKIKNEFWSIVCEDFEQLKLNFLYIPDPLTGFYSYKPEHQIPCPSPEIFSYKVVPVPIYKGETKILEVEVTFLQSGAFKLKSLELLFLGMIPFTYELQDAPSSKYNDLRVNPSDTGSIEVIAQALASEIHFGEITRGCLSIKNKGSSAIEELYLISTEPLYTGFGFKPLPELDAGGEQKMDLYIRGIEPKLNTISLVFVYKTKGAWKFCFYVFDIRVHRSFSTKYHSEDIGGGKRMVCIDVINGKDYSHVKPEDLEVCSLRLNSNTWHIEKNSCRLVADSRIVMLYFNVEPRSDVKPETQYLARKHREVGCSDLDLSLRRKHNQVR